MVILHTADWHLGKRLEHISRYEEQKEVMQEICEIAERENVDVVVIAGDLFDTFNPPVEAVELFYKTVKRLAKNGKRAVIAIAGNHDSPERIEAPDPLARECGIIFAGYPQTIVPTCKLESGICVLQSEEGFIELKLPGYQYPLRIILTAYANESRLKTFLGIENSDDEFRNLLARRWSILADKYCDDKGVNIMAAHLYMMKKGEEPPEEPDEEKPIHIGGASAVYSENVPPQLQYVALGHLHRRQTIDRQPCPIVYSSSPLAYSLSEINQDKFVVIVDAEPGKPVGRQNIRLTTPKKVLKARFEDVETAIDWLKEHPNTLVELILQTHTFLTAEDKKRILSVNEDVFIRPDPRQRPENGQPIKESVDLTKGIDELFVEYFKSRHGQEPNDNLMNLLKEILGSSQQP